MELMGHEKQALIGGVEAEFVEALPHAAGDKRIVVCDVLGKRCYVTEAEWAAGCEAYNENSEKANIVTSSSGRDAKISLFRSLFRGRDDVYAKGYAKKDGGIGYGPVCGNLWKQGICQKKLGKGAKCTECPGDMPTSGNGLLRGRDRASSISCGVVR